MNNQIWAAESVAKSFGRRMILQNAGCWAYAGAISVLLGRNGCGKTTLVKIGVGRLRPDGGVVILNGRRSIHPRLATLARDGLFYLSQDRMLTPALTVAEHLEAIAAMFPEATVQTAIDITRLEALLPRRAHTLSGGELRRTELALAVARNPTCLVADEPFLGIAPTDSQLFSTIFRQMADAGCALFITGHEVETLFPLADHVIWMTGGTTHHLGTRSEALEHHQFVQEYVGPERLGRLRT